MAQKIKYLVNTIHTAKARNPEADVSIHEVEIDKLIYQIYSLSVAGIDIINTAEQTAVPTLKLVISIRELMAETKKRLREELPKIYSQDLLNNLFRHPYTRIEYVCGELKVHYNTAASYLKALTDAGFLQEEKLGQGKYYINKPLVELFRDVSAGVEE